MNSSGNNLKWLPLDELYVDRTYQRDLDAAHVQKILAKFNWRFFQAITVTNTEDGYAVIDGQHRVTAALAHPDIKKVPCLVVEAASVTEQAEGFIVMNKTQRRITPVEMYWAALSAGLPEYLKMEAMLDRVGVEVYGTSGYGVLPPKTTVAVNTILKLLNRHGPEHIEAALRVIVTAWPETTGAVVTRIIETMENLLRRGAVDEVTAIKGLRIWEPAKLVARSRVVATEKEIKTTEAVAITLFGERMAVSV